MSQNYFQELYDIDITDRIKKKNNLDYLPWSSAWAFVKAKHPDATYITYYNENGRFWFDDGVSGWVRIGVTINGVEHVEDYPIMDMRNQAIPAEKIKSTDANKAQKRGLVKCCAMHGLGMNLYEGEELNSDGSRMSAGQKEFAAAKKKLVSVCKDLQAYGIDRAVILGKIAEMNGGNQNPNSVQSTMICNEIIDTLLEMKGE